MDAKHGVVPAIDPNQHARGRPFVSNEICGTRFATESLRGPLKIHLVSSPTKLASSLSCYLVLVSPAPPAGLFFRVSTVMRRGAREIERQRRASILRRDA
jgi:hypothetical protein